LDNRLQKLSAKHGFTYTRYADDLVFSHPQKDTDLTPLINTTKKIIEDENFVMHPDKLMVMRPHNRQSVTGIIVNEKLNISRKDLKNFRSFLHHYKKEGAITLSAKLGKDATQYGRGYWAFIYMVDPVKAKKMAMEHRWLQNGKLKVEN